MFKRMLSNVAKLIDRLIRGNPPAMTEAELWKMVQEGKAIYLGNLGPGESWPKEVHK